MAGEDDSVSDLACCFLCDQQWGSEDTDAWTWTGENDVINDCGEVDWRQDQFAAK